jgi:hypothetical protein
MSALRVLFGWPLGAVLDRQFINAMTLARQEKDQRAGCEHKAGFAKD